MSRGYVIVEASLAYVVVTVAVVALLPLFTMCFKANMNTQHVAIAAQLSTELMEEVGLRKWDEHTPATPQHISNPRNLFPSVPDGEIAGLKNTFKAINAFNGWSEQPPQNPLGTTIPKYGGFSRTVTEQYVDSNLNPVGGHTDYKQVTVCTTWPWLKPVCLDKVFTNR